MSDNENDYNSDSEYDPYVDDVDYDEDDPKTKISKNTTMIKMV